MDFGHSLHAILFSIFFTSISVALRYDPTEASWNLNEQQDALHPLDYTGIWKDHNFNPSPSNWRFPFYVLMLDRFANGNPSNDDANNTQFEHQWLTTQLRYGGDTIGVANNLDYLQGMGIKVRFARRIMGGFTDTT